MTKKEEHRREKKRGLCNKGEKMKEQIVTGNKDTTEGIEKNKESHHMAPGFDA